ncbi:MAG: hypothetical protein U1E79_06125 [Ottowia sp.]
MGRTGYFVHPDCRLHDMGAGHPECPARIDAIEDRLLITGVADALERREPAPATMGELLLAHGRRHVAALRGLSDMLAEEVAAGGPNAFSLDPDTSINTTPGAPRAAVASAAIDAVNCGAARRAGNTAFCHPLPATARARPGHGHGCFGNVAIAATSTPASAMASSAWPSSTSTCTGNGTEDIVHGDERILMVSFCKTRSTRRRRASTPTWSTARCRPTPAAWTSASWSR